MRFRVTTRFYLVSIFFLLTSTPLHAQDHLPRDGFWAGLDLGGGILEQTSDTIDNEDSTFYMGFKGGYWLSNHILAGLELSGWLQQASNLNDPDKGEGLGQVFLITHIYPGTESNFFINLGGGYVSHWNKRPGEPNRKHGFGVTVGGGYDVVFDNKWAITPFLSYSLGETGDEDYKALTLGVGFSVAF